MEIIRSECIDHGKVGDKDGYLITHRNIEGKRTKLRLHRYVYFMTHGEWPQVCRHTCDNPRCINPEHLIDGTPRDNVHDMMSRGRGLRGEQKPLAKLTVEQVRSIRDRYKYRSADANSFTLAAEFNVSQHLIMRVLKRKVWAHV